MSQGDKEIQTQLQSYLTIACNYRFDVLVTLISGEKFKGRAFATGTNEQKQNCFIRYKMSEQKTLGKVTPLEVEEKQNLTENINSEKTPPKDAFKIIVGKTSILLPEICLKLSPPKACF